LRSPRLFRLIFSQNRYLFVTAFTSFPPVGKLG